MHHRQADTREYRRRERPQQYGVVSRSRSHSPIRSTLCRVANRAHAIKRTIMSDMHMTNRPRSHDTSNYTDRISVSITLHSTMRFCLLLHGHTTVPDADGMRHYQHHGNMRSPGCLSKPRTCHDCTLSHNTSSHDGGVNANDTHGPPKSD